MKKLQLFNVGLYHKAHHMKILKTVAGLKKQITGPVLRPLGFVPTMGALHKGHLSLVEKAINDCPSVVVSIYVNPTQFNDREDLINYPRTPEDDIALLSGIMRKNDYVLMPRDKEIYPEEDNRVFDFGNLDKVMEGIHRPGHFNGVAKVVSRLFDIVNPDIAYFGQKDFQQLVIIRELVRQCGYKVKIVACPIIRENDGLAMSSRNRLLDPQIRKNAGIIYKSLLSASKMIKSQDIPEIKKFVTANIEAYEGFKVEYFEIVEETRLIPLSFKNDMKSEEVYFGCIAVKAGRIRLIDNIKIPLP